MSCVIYNYCLFLKRKTFYVVGVTLSVVWSKTFCFENKTIYAVASSGVAPGVIIVAALLLGQKRSLL